VKKFVLLRGESGTLYLYETKVWDHIQETHNAHGYEFVTDSDDSEELRRFQYLTNDKMEG
jgi:hypothetical protein